MAGQATSYQQRLHVFSDNLQTRIGKFDTTLLEPLILARGLLMPGPARPQRRVARALLPYPFKQAAHNHDDLEPK